MTHLLVMILFAALVSLVFSTIARDTNKSRLLYALRVFGEFVGIALVLAWVLYLLPF